MNFSSSSFAGWRWDWFSLNLKWVRMIEFVWNQLVVISGPKFLDTHPYLIHSSKCSFETNSCSVSPSSPPRPKMKGSPPYFQQNATNKVTQNETRLEFAGYNPLQQWRPHGFQNSFPANSFTISVVVTADKISCWAPSISSGQPCIRAGCWPASIHGSPAQRFFFGGELHEARWITLPQMRYTCNSLLYLCR